MPPNNAHPKTLNPCPSLTPPFAGIYLEKIGFLGVPRLNEKGLVEERLLLEDGTRFQPILDFRDGSEVVRDLLVHFDLFDDLEHQRALVEVNEMPADHVRIAIVDESQIRAIHSPVRGWVASVSPKYRHRGECLTYKGPAEGRD